MMSSSSMETRSNPAPTPSKWFATMQQVRKFSFRWSIVKFACRLEKNEQFVRSPCFSPDDMPYLEWTLDLYPNCDSAEDEDEDHIQLYLTLKQSSVRPIFSMFKFRIIGVDSNVAKLIGPFEREYKINGDGYGTPSLISRREIFADANKYLVDGTLTVQCDGFVVVPGDVHEEVSSKIAIPEGVLSTNIGCLLETQRMADVTFVVDGQEVKAHKAILATRSPVFAAMFESNFKESESNRVTIEDIGHEAFQQLLNFVYTDSVKNIDSIANELLVAANKYDLTRLSVLCQESIRRRLTVENAVDSFLLAETHLASELRNESIKFIKSNMAKVMKTDGWQTLVSSFPHLLLWFITVSEASTKEKSILDLIPDSI